MACRHWSKTVKHTISVLVLQKSSRFKGITTSFFVKLFWSSRFVVCFKVPLFVAVLAGVVICHVHRSFCHRSCFYVLFFVTLYDPVVCHVLGALLMLGLTFLDLVICPVFSCYLFRFQVSLSLLFRSHNLSCFKVSMFVTVLGLIIFSLFLIFRSHYLSHL